MQGGTVATLPQNRSTMAAIMRLIAKPGRTPALSTMVGLDSADPWRDGFGTKIIQEFSDWTSRPPPRIQPWRFIGVSAWQSAHYGTLEAPSVIAGRGLLAVSLPGALRGGRK
ncbi:hypothetical protein GCM10022293_49050 [Azospirillum formosense]